MSHSETQPASTSLLGRIASRRTFIRSTAFTALAASTLAACRRASALQSSAKAPATSAPPAAVRPLAPPVSAADAMDAMHEKGIRAFPAKTEGKGNQLLVPRIDRGVKVFDVTASKIRWEVAPGQLAEAWAYNGQVPGPQIRVTEGDRVRVVLRNQLEESTSIHFHGLELPNDQDGVPFITQPPVKPGQTYTYEFTAPNPGTHMYHSHHDSTKQVGLGLLGAFIIAPRHPRPIERVDHDYVFVLNDGAHGYTFNGKSFPATEPLTAKRGETIRIRFMNEGMMIHPMHLHGMHMTVIDKDGWPQPQPWRCDTLNVAPGERWDVIVRCTNPGTWAFHCHILPHAESSQGMFGMVTALIVV
ncbi:MAG TPA: copper oxidase [Gemmatimonadaceae bacterium]